MTAPTAPLVSAPARRPRSASVLVALSLLLALWAGLTAPTTSPVSPAGQVAPAVVQVDDRVAEPDLRDRERRRR